MVAEISDRRSTRKIIIIMSRVDYKGRMLIAGLRQSSAMDRRISVVAHILALFAVASTVPANFPRGKTVVYKYYGDAKAGTIEPASYASQFALEGTLYVKHETSDPALTNAYYVVLSEVKTGMHNGIAAHYERTKVLTPIGDAARVIQEPFLIVYDDNGTLQGVKIPENELEWSKNMKIAMASMLQLDLPGIKFEDPVKPRSFISKENTIHGDCWITYDVHAKDQINPNDSEIVVTKFSSPQNCSGFVIREFDHVDDEECQAKKEEPTNVASRRLFEIEKQGEDILIKKLVAHGTFNYFPWNARSEAHYVLTNTTFVLEKVVPVAEINLTSMNFQDVPMTRDLTYRKPKGSYARGAAVDVTQGRHVVNLEATMTKLKKLLGEAADYLKENHLETEESDGKHGHTLNKILDTMSYMDTVSFDQVLKAYQDSKTPRDVTIKNIFLDMIPHVGTAASCNFTLNVVDNPKIAEIKKIGILSQLSMNVKEPNPDLLHTMYWVRMFLHRKPIKLRKACVLSYATLNYRTYKNIPNVEEDSILRLYISDLHHRIEKEPYYVMKLTYIMAFKNLHVGNIYKDLAPIVRGDRTIDDNPMDMRLHATWAIAKSIEGDYPYARDLLWPLMADKSLPVKLRITAYEILIHQAPSMGDVLRIYWFMVYETNEHLYNYHYTTIKGIANSVDPCKINLRENVRKIMRFTRRHDNIRYTLSSAYSFDYKDEKYNHAEKFHMGMIVNEVTGVPEILHFKHIITDGRKPVSDTAIRLHVRGCDGLMAFLTRGQIIRSANLSNSNVLELLRKAANDLPAPKKVLIDFIVMSNDRVVLVNSYDEKTWKKLVKDFDSLSKVLFDIQKIAYANLYEKQVISDMGLPVVTETRIPRFTSLKFNYTGGSEKSFEFDVKMWRHGDYSMSIYNPIADVWHAIRRSTATDVSVPIRASIVYNPETNNVKIKLSSATATKLLAAGVRTHAKDSVTVNEDGVEALRKSCATCSNNVDVSLGTAQKKNYQNTIDSRDTGLRYSMSIFDCESGVTPVTLSEEWFRAFMSDRKTDWNNPIVHSVLATRQLLKNMFISPQMGSCGILLKVQPSIVYPTSRIDLNMRMSHEDVDHVNPRFHAFGSKKYNIHGTVDAIAATMNTSSRSWDLNVNVDVNQGHLLNTAKIQLTRKTPGETNLKICVDAQKSYYPGSADPLKLNLTKEETNSKLTIAVGRTNEEQCVRDDYLITITVKGEISNEQKKQFRQDMENGACSNDISNPLYANTKNIVPKTLNCLNEIIRHTTLRNYTINVAHKNVPQNITSMILHYEDILRSRLLPNLKYTIDHTVSRNIKINVEYPVHKDVVDLSVSTPTRSYDLIDVDFAKSLFSGFGPVIKPVWHWPLDNTRFGIMDLDKYTADMLKMCSVYPQIVLTGDGKDVPFNITEQWILISGDHVDKSFAVFAKMTGTNMAVKIYAADHQLEIVPNADDSVQTMVDGQAVDTLENGFLVPNNIKNWILKVTKDNDHVLVQMKDVPVIVVHGINHVALAIDTLLQGKVSGLCGHLDGTYLTKIRESYTMTNL